MAAEERKAARALAAEQEAKARSEAAEEERKNAPPPPGHLDPFGNPSASLFLRRPVASV